MHSCQVILNLVLTNLRPWSDHEFENQTTTDGKQENSWSDHGLEFANTN